MYIFSVLRDKAAKQCGQTNFINKTSRKYLAKLYAYAFTIISMYKYKHVLSQRLVLTNWCLSDPYNSV
jgi:hypothetical protein